MAAGHPRRAAAPEGTARPGLVALIAGVATALALALRLYQLARPGYLTGVTEYDDGVYFGSAVRLLHGTVPYRDFVLIQPPGIVLLLAPLALLAKATGTAAAFATARVLTACVAAASVALAGWLVRHRGPLATTIACGLLAVYPSGMTAAHTVLLEPWLVLFCLLGAACAFDGDAIVARPWRLGWAGAAFGVAIAVKLWAVLPALVLAALCWRALSWRGALRYVAGAAAGFAVLVLPFFVLAPGAVWRDIVVAQVTRADLSSTPAWTRLQSLAGLSVLRTASHARVALAVGILLAFALLCLAGAWLRTRRAPPPLECFAAGSGVLTLAAFLWPPDYYPHYAWFFAPFLAMTLALPADRLLGSLTGSAARREGATVAVGVLAAAAVAGVVGVRQFQQLSSLRAGSPAPMVRRATAPGACVLTDIPAVNILADRFTSSDPACPSMVDPIGTSYALAGGRNGVTGAGNAPAVAAIWLRAFAAAQYVWLQCPPWTRPQCLTARRVPWTNTLRTYFERHFEPLPGQGPTPNLFRRRVKSVS